MSGPAVNIGLRLDQSKIAADAKKAESALKSAINPTIDIFNVAEKTAKGLAIAMGAALKVIGGVAQHTGGWQQLDRAIDSASTSLYAAADRSGALRTAFAETDKVVRRLSEYLSSDAGRGAVNSFFATMVTGAADTIDAINGMYRAAVDAIEALKKISVLEDFRRGLVGRGLSDGISESLAEPTSDEKYGKASTAAEDFSTSLRNAAKAGVEASGTFVDPKATAAQKAAEAAQAALEKAINDAFARARKQQIDELKARQEHAEAAGKIEQSITDMAAANAARREDIHADEVKLAASRVSLAIATSAELAEIQQQQILRDAQGAEASRLSFSALSDIASAGAASISAGIQAGFSGSDFGTAVAQALGPAISGLGASLFLMGTAALALNAVATFFPPIAAAFGIVPGLGVAAAVGAIGAGALLMGGGAAISSLAGGGGSGRAPASGGGSGAGAGPRARGPTTTPQGFQGSSQGGSSPIVINNSYSFNGPIGGSPRRIARDLGDLIDSNRTLQPSRSGGR